MRRLPWWLLVASGCAALVPGRITGQGGRDVARVVVLQGVRSDAARELVESLRRRLEGGKRVELDVVPVDGEGGESRARSDRGATVVVALGSRALVQAARDHRGVPTVAALVTRESVIPDGVSATAVVLEFPMETEFEMMRRLLPKVRRVGVLFGTDENARLVARAREAAQAQGMQLVARRVNTPAELPSALSALAGDADVLWGIPDDVVLTAETAKAVLLFSMRNRIPFVGLSTQWVKAGALYALDRDYGDLGAQVADVATRLLDGAPVKSLPTASPRKSVYVLNAHSAEMMRVSFSPDVLRGAREVIR